MTWLTGLAARAVAVIPTPPADVDPSTGKGPEWGKAAPVGLLVILLLCLAMFFLMRSMNRKIKAVPASFDPPAADIPAGSVSAPASAVQENSAVQESSAVQEGSVPPAPDTEPGAPDRVNERTR